MLVVRLPGQRVGRLSFFRGSYQSPLEGMEELSRSLPGCKLGTVVSMVLHPHSFSVLARQLHSYY